MSELFQAARATDPIGHGYGMLGILGGVVVGALIVAAGVVTGGAAIALVIAAGALSGAALANGIQRVAGAKNPWTGNIGFGSTNVRINSLGAARVIMDFATPVCNGLYGVNHFPLLPIPPIAEGSKTVRINGRLAARVTSRLICAADITDGSPNVWIGGPTEQVLPVIDIEAIVTTAAMAVVIGATFVISGPVMGFVYLAGGTAVTSGIGYLADTYLGEGWGDIINGSLGFLALGLGAVASRRAKINNRYNEIGQNGHAVQRHGKAITEQQLSDRAMYKKDPVTGTTNDAYNRNPDGTPKPHKAGKNATKFNNKESLVKAEDHIKNSQEYNDALADAAANNRESFVVKDTKLEDVYGPNYRNRVSGRTRTGSANNPTGTTPTDFTDGTIKAVYKKDANGVWHLETMYPEPKP